MLNYSTDTLNLFAWLSLLLAGALIWLFASPALAAREPAALQVWDVGRQKQIRLPAAVVTSARARLITVGEFHDQPTHHRAQLAVIKAFYRAGIPVAVGLEMWRQPDQKSLDDWLAGKIDEDAMADRMGPNWGRNWALYREIFQFCRAEGLEMIALNLPREVTRKVAAQGYGALTEAEKQMVPPLKCDLEADYKAYLQKVYDKHIAPSTSHPKKAHAKKGGPKPSKGHGSKFKNKHGHSKDFNSFCLAQVAWDAAMAWRAVRYLEANEDRTMVVIAGMAHAARQGIPYQTSQMAENLEIKVFQPQVAGLLDRNHAKIAKVDFLVLDLDQAFGGPDVEGGKDDGPI